MRKQNKTAFSMILAICALAFIGFSGYFKNAETKLPVVNSNYDELSGMNLEQDYPDDPIDVVILNNKIMYCLYGGGVQDEEIEPVILLQRQLFADALLESPNNSLDIQLANIRSEIEMLRERKQRVLRIEEDQPIYDRANPYFCEVDVVQYTNTGINNNVRYFMTYENEKWKIIRWEKK